MTLIALPLYDGHSVDGIIIIIIIVLPLGRFLPPTRGVLIQPPWALSVVSIPDPRYRLSGLRIDSLKSHSESWGRVSGRLPFN